MKNSLIKSILLGAIAIGMMVGCDDNPQTSSQLPTSSNTSSVISSSSSDIISSSTTSSSISSSSTSSSSSSVAPTLTGITLDTTNVKKAYKYGDKLNLAGLVVTANYSDNSAKAVTDYTTDPANESTLNTHGEVTIKVTYQSFNEQFTITVDKVLTEITLNTDNVKKDYYTGDALDLTGLEVTAKYSDNTTSVVTDYIVNPANGTVFSAIKEETVTITYQGKTASFKVKVTKAPKTAWTEQEANLMATVLYGEVLPFTGFEESQVRYNAQYNAIVIVGGEATQESLLAYARALSFNGYLLVSSTELLFEKSVMTDAGKRHVQVNVVNNEGQLGIVALDPYYYSFPTDFATYVANTYFASTAVLPAIQADYFEVIESNTAVAIIAYLSATTDDAGYSEILSTAGWTVQDEKINGNYIAVAPDSSYMVVYTYDAEHEALLIMYSPVNFWNDAPIKAFFAKYNGTYVELPAFNVTDGQYYFEEYENNDYYYEKGNLDMVVAFLKIYGGSKADADNYMALLKAAGFKALNSGNSYSATKAIEGKGLFRLDYSYDPEKEVITLIFYIYLEPFPTTEFPQDEISEALGGYLVDKVPGYVGETTGFQLNDDSYGLYIVVEVEQGTELAAIEAYKATLVQNGYSPRYEGSSEYLSEHHEIVISLQKDAGSFKIIIMREPYNAWPTAQIAAYLGEEVTDKVPDFTDADADEFTFEPTKDGLAITISYYCEEDDQGEEIEIDVEEIAIDYIHELEDNNNFFYVDEVDGVKYYSSENFQIIVGVECDDVWDEIYIYIMTPDQYESEDEWQVQHIQYFLDKHNYTDNLPEYEGEFVSAKATIELSTLRIDVVLDTTDADEIKAEADAYIAALEEARFTYFEEFGEGRCKRYLSPHNQYEVSVMYQPDGFTVQIDEIANERQETTTFPTEELYAAHPELEGVLPIVVDGEATFDTQIQSDWVEIFVMYEDVSLIPAAMEAYEKALVEKGFRKQEDTAGYDVVYFSPDESYYVCVTDWSTYDTPGFDIEIYYM